MVGRARPAVDATVVQREPEAVSAAEVPPASVPPVAVTTPVPVPVEPARKSIKVPGKTTPDTEPPLRQAKVGRAATYSVELNHAEAPIASKKKGGKGRWVVAGIVVTLVALYNIGRNEQESNAQMDCNTAFDLGSKAVTTGDLEGARGYALRAVATCTDGQRGKADALQGAIAAAEKTNDACTRTFRTVESQVQEGRLVRARKGLDALSTTCAAKPAADVLRDQLSDAQTAERAALVELRNAIEARDAAQSKVALEKLTGLNRENADLDGLKAEVKELSEAFAAEEAANAEAATAAANTPVVETRVPATPIAPRVLDRPVSQVASRNSETIDSRASMVSTFLRDAEQALGQRKFDAARTYVDSARRIDPNDPRLDSLMQQIRDRERQMLQQETTIK